MIGNIFPSMSSTKDILIKTKKLMKKPIKGVGMGIKPTGMNMTIDRISPNFGRRGVFSKLYRQLAMSGDPYVTVKLSGQLHRRLLQRARYNRRKLPVEMIARLTQSLHHQQAYLQEEVSVQTKN